MPGGWAGDAASAFTGEGLGPEQRDAQEWVRALFQWRKRTPVLHDGGLVHYAPQDGVYVYFRYDGQDTVMVALNRNPRTTPLALARFACFLPAGVHARDALGGKPVALGTSLELPAQSATILELARD